MLDTRNLRLDLLALVLLAGTVFLAIALATYSPDDPPAALVYPPAAAWHNACGRWGALAAHYLLTALGVGAYYLVVSLAICDAWLLARRPVKQPALRLLGWLLSLGGLTTLAVLAFPGLAPGPAIGPGGYLGAALRGLLQLNFAHAGALILTLCTLAGGLLLCTDYVVLKFCFWLLGRPVHAARRGGTLAASVVKQRRAALARLRNEHEEAAGPKIRVRNRQTDMGGAPPVPSTSEPVVRKPAKLAGAAAEILEAPVAGDDPDDSEPDELDSRQPRVRNPATKRDERKQMMQALDAAAHQADEDLDYELPPIDLLKESELVSYDQHEQDVRQKAKILEKTFGNFGFNVRVVEIETGPVIAQFEVELEAGLRLSKITGLADDLAIALRVPSVRIVAPIPGKNTVGIEVPNAERQLVRLREVIEEGAAQSQKCKIPIYLGKDVAGNPMICDLTSLPHLLIAGRTGTGKSVCLNTIIASMLMMRRPDEVRMLLIDPKMVELSPYKTLPHLMHPVVTDMRKAEAILAWAVEKMEERYALLARAGVRHLAAYNQLGGEELIERLQPESDEEREQIPLHLPYIVIVADEMADLMMTAPKEVETHIIRLAQKSRAVGIHLVLATQKPTVDVITGLIKSNLPARICFQVASRTDSRVVLDEMGADKLLGNGDMLFLWPGTSTMLRGQGTYVSDEEITKVVEFVSTTEPQFVKELVQLQTEGDDAGKMDRLRARDDLYEAAVDVVVREGRGSVSLLQRALGIGYGRAARLIDFMAEDGLVGIYNGSQAREVLISVEQWEEMKSQPPAPAERKPRSNKIRPSVPEEPAEPPFRDSPSHNRRTVVLPELDDEDDEYEPDPEDDADADFEDE